MEKKSSRNTNSMEMVVNIIAMAIITIIASLYIKDSSSIKIVGDEFGYWSSGAWMAGYDWSEVASYNNYYGYGYGVILALILKLNLNYRITYQLALCINVLMLVCIYILAYKLINKVNAEIGMLLRVVIAMTACLYTGVLYYTQYVMSETIISLLFWVFIYNSYCLLEKYSIKRILFLSLVLAFAFSVHQRLLGVLAIGVLFLIYCVLKNKRPKDLLIVVSLVTILVLLVIIIKNNYQNTYLSLSDISLGVNDFGGQVSKIKSLLSIEGIKTFFVGFIGKLFYAISSSFMLFLVFFVWIINELKKSIKEKTITLNLEFLILIVFSTLASIAIAVVFLLNYKSRYDILIYGRYFEFTLGPIIVLSLTYILGNMDRLKNCEILHIIYILVTLVVFNNIPYEAGRSHVFLTCTGVADILFKYDYNIMLVCARTVVVFSILMCFSRIKHKDFIKIIPILLIMVIWVNSFSYIYKEKSLSWTRLVAEKEEELAEKIIYLEAGDNLYYYIAENNTIQIDFLQFILKDYSINTFANYEDVYSLGENEYILTINNTKLFEQVKDVQYEAVFSTHYITMWKCVN